MGKLTEQTWNELVNHLSHLEQLTVMERLEILEKVDPTFQGAIAERRRLLRRSAAEALKSEGTQQSGFSL